MNKKEVKKDIIDFGKYFLKKNIKSEWDFYRKNEECKEIENAKRCTYERFESVEVVGDLVYVSKEERGFTQRGIYTIDGKAKIAITDRYIDCGETLLVKEDTLGWDFYSKQGEKLTNKSFDYIMVIGNLVKVTKSKLGESNKSGIYDTNSNEVLAIEWKDIFIIPEKAPKNPRYIKVKNQDNYWGICDACGRFILQPNKFISIEHIEKEYLKVKDLNGNEGLYKFASKGIKEIFACSGKYTVDLEIKDNIKTGFTIENDDEMYFYSFKSKKLLDVK